MKTLKTKFLPPILELYQFILKPNLLRNFQRLRERTRQRSERTRERCRIDNFFLFNNNNISLSTTTTYHVSKKNLKETTGDQEQFEELNGLIQQQQIDVDLTKKQNRSGGGGERAVAVAVRMGCSATGRKRHN